MDWILRLDSVARLKLTRTWIEAEQKDKNWMGFQDCMDIGKAGKMRDRQGMDGLIVSLDKAG